MSDKHLRDIRGVLKVMGREIEGASIERWVQELGLTREWSAVGLPWLAPFDHNTSSLLLVVGAGLDGSRISGEDFASETISALPFGAVQRGGKRFSARLQVLVERARIVRRLKGG